MVWKEHSTLITIERANLTITYIAMKQLSTICKVSKVLMLHNSARERYKAHTPK